MKIREYNSDDAEGMAEVHRQSIREVASEDYRDEVLEVWATEEADDSPLSSEKARFVAETDEGEVVGFSTYNKQTNELSGLYVKPEHTGKGLGEKLLQKAEEDAKNNGLDYLQGKSTITAKEFYQEHGYEIQEEITHEIDGIGMTAYKMKKDLTQKSGC